MEIQYRPIDAWPDKLRDDSERSFPRFNTTFTETLNLLERELEALDAEWPTVEVDTKPGNIRIDGRMRADATVGHPGVILSFDSRYGPQRYWTDKYTSGNAWRMNGGNRRLIGWQMNLRAIALSLEALRKVDRYGVSERGEQYQGWSQLGSGIVVPTEQEGMSKSEAAKWLADAACFHEVPVGVIMKDPDMQRRAYRQAAAVLHPDQGGDPELFKKLSNVMEVLAR